MKIRYKPEQDPVEVSLKEFIRLTETGRIRPDTLVSAQFFTPDGEWWTADNFYLFHNHSPEKHPYSERLKEHDRREVLQRKIQARLRRNFFRQKKVGFIACAQRIERRSRVGHPAKLAREAGVTRVARLIVCPSFFLNTIVTLFYDKQGIRVEAVRGPSRSVARISAAEAGYMGLSWPEMLILARQAESCDNLSLDGVGFFHRAATAKQLIHAYWGNPTGRHFRQIQLIDLYSKILHSKPSLASVRFDQTL